MRLSPLCARTAPGAAQSLGTCTFGTLGISGVCCASSDIAEAGDACAGSLAALNRFGRPVEGVDREANGLGFSEVEGGAGFGASAEVVVDGVKDGKPD